MTPFHPLGFFGFRLMSTPKTTSPRTKAAATTGHTGVRWLTVQILFMRDLATASVQVECLPNGGQWSLLKEAA
jgi:hypothetical protein